MSKLLAMALLVYAITIMPQAHADEFFISPGEAVTEVPTANGGMISIPTWLYDTCNAKGDLAILAYENRETAPIANILMTLHHDWKYVWSTKGVTHASYVDMQRIVRDAYRKNNDGVYITSAETQDEILATVDKEVGNCLESKF